MYILLVLFKNFTSIILRIINKYTEILTINYILKEMLTKYKFLFNSFSRNGRNLSLKNMRCSKFSSQPDTKSTVRIKPNSLR